MFTCICIINYKYPLIVRLELFCVRQAYEVVRVESKFVHLRLKVERVSTIYVRLAQTYPVMVPKSKKGNLLQVPLFDIY